MYNPSDIWSYYITRYVHEGDAVIDATAGNGHDTLALKKAVGASGTVYAFDIQEQALKNTKERLLKNHCLDGVNLILDSHVRMDQYIHTPVQAVFFNLGYLPGGNHAMATQGETSIAAIQRSLALLADGGFVSVTVYRGGDTGFEEEKTVLSFLKALDHKKYTVLLFDFYNRPNHPPLTAIITKRV